MPGLITDFVLSLDDRYLYLVNWLHGDIRQYNIEDPAKPVLAGQVWVGGLLQKGSDVVYVTNDDKEEQYNVPQVKVIPPLKILLSLCIVKSRIYMGPILCK
jgi:methanethiol oxidase